MGWFVLLGIKALQYEEMFVRSIAIIAYFLWLLDAYGCYYY